MGAVIGALAAGRVADLIGRRRTVLITACVFVVGVLLATFTPTYPVLLAARVVIGLAVGSASMVVPLYIGEVVPPRVRGGLVSLNQLAITSGILVSYLIDYGLSGSGNWRLMFGLAAIPAVLLFSGMLFQKESPAWLIRQDRIDEARDVLKRLRDSDDIESEIHDVQEVSRKQAGTRELLSPKVRPLLMVGVLLAVFQQITGINTVIYYALTLLQGAGFGSSAALLANVVNGAVNVGMTIVAIWLLDRVGRRPLLLSGTAGIAVAMAITACGFWLLIAEIYPLRIRGAAMSVATIANWGANFVVMISFLTPLSAIDGVGVFFLFGFLTLVALAYFWRKVPGTKGRSLQEIERELTGSTDLSEASA